MPRSRQCLTSSWASDRAEASSRPDCHAAFTPATSAWWSGGSRLNQSQARRPVEAVADTASRREPVAEGVEDAGEVAADFGDGFF